MFIENGGKYYRAGPEMNRYLDSQLTELENTGQFDRNKFARNKISKIIFSLFESDVEHNNPIIPILGKINYIVNNFQISFSARLS